MRVRAASLNYRDQAVVAGQYFGGAEQPRPDTAVRRRGRRHRRWIGVSRASRRRSRRRPRSFRPRCHSRCRPRMARHSTACLRSASSLNEDGLVSIPEHLSYEEAACLPCAAVTAWHALFHAGRPTQSRRHRARARNRRGVDCALQFAKATGARVIATSSSDEKAARATSARRVRCRELQAHAGMGAGGQALTSGRGVDCVIEIGGGRDARAIDAIARAWRESLSDWIPCRPRWRYQSDSVDDGGRQPARHLRRRSRDVRGDEPGDRGQSA